jgi:hypothetical protein
MCICGIENRIRVWNYLRPLCPMNVACPINIISRDWLPRHRFILFPQSGTASCWMLSFPFSPLEAGTLAGIILILPASRYDKLYRCTNVCCISLSFLPSPFKRSQYFFNCVGFGGYLERYLGTTVINQNLIQEEIKRKLNSDNAC